jgi:hypothetical protein
MGVFLGVHTSQCMHLCVFYKHACRFYVNHFLNANNYKYDNDQNFVVIRQI